MRPRFGCAAAILGARRHGVAASAQTTIIERDSPSVITRERVDLTPGAADHHLPLGDARARPHGAAAGVEVQAGRARSAQPSSSTTCRQR